MATELTQEEKLRIVDKVKTMYENNSDPKMDFGLEDLYQKHRKQLIMDYPPLNKEDQLINTLMTARNRVYNLLEEAVLPKKMAKAIEEIEQITWFMSVIIKDYRKGG